MTSKISPATVKPGGKATLIIQVTIAPDFHINAHKPADAYAIPTTFTPSTVAGVTFGAPKYPAPVKVSEAYSPTPMLVYTKSATISVPVTFSKTASGKLVLGGTLGFQGCNHEACLPPKRVPVSATLIIK